MIALASALGSAWLAWSILGRIRPAFRLAGTVLLLWNPVVLVELSAEGHNDGLMTFFVLLAIFIFGGEVIRGFSFALLIGIVIGTYSSICIATPIVIDFQKLGKKA